MLDYIRSNTQSVGVKLAFGVIILVFVFWGVGSFTEGDSSRVMASINGEPILETQFYKQYQMVENRLMNRGMSRDQMRAEHVGRQVLQTMIAHTLVRQEAERLGFAITPQELRAAIEQIPIFQNNQGKLDKESYERGLSALRVSSAEYEAQVRDELLYNRLLDLVAGSVWNEPDDARQHYDFLFEKRVFDYIFLPSAQYEKNVTLTDDEKKKYYDEHTGKFTIPKRADLTYVRITPDRLVDPATLSQADIEKWYREHIQDYTQTEAVRCAHILIPLAPGADAAARQQAEQKIAEIRKELKNGKTFADLANTYNSQAAADKDGELGWIERGVTVEPFEKAAFSQEPGRVSEHPVQTQFGLHLILVHEKRPEKIRPIAEVRDEIAKALALDLGRDRMTEVGESLLEDNLLGKDLREVSKKFGLTAEKSGLLSAQEIVSRLSIRPEDIEQILSGLPVDTLLQAGDAVLVVHVDTVEKEQLKPFATVEGEISKVLVQEKAQKMATEKAAELRGTLRDAPLTEQERRDLHVETSAPVDRHSPMAPFAMDTALSHACFETGKGHWIPSPFPVRREDGTTGAILVYVQDIRPAETAANWEKMQTIMENGLRQENIDSVKSLFIDELQKKSSITNVQMEKADKFGG